jgi:hypothetical protein
MTTWKSSKAKQMLQYDILDGKTKGKSAAEVYEMHVEFKTIPYKNFKTNFKRLQDKIEAKGLPKKKWRNSKEKEMLRKDILDGKTEGKPVADVYAMHVEFKAFSFNNFKSNYSRLSDAIDRQLELANDDTAAFYNDTIAWKNRPPPSQLRKPFWDTHAAKKLLKKDIDAEKHKKMKPKELQSTRAEYMEFDLEVFRKHIHQELRDRANAGWWNRKKRH